MTRAVLGVPKGGHAPREAVSLTDTESLLASDSGKIFFLNKAGGFTTTLPAAADAGPGWNVRIVIGTALSSGSYVITELTTSDTDKICSVFSELVTTTNDDGQTNAAHTLITMADTKETKGDFMDIYCDGLYFYAIGVTNLKDGVALS